MDEPRGEYERRLASRRDRIAALDRINLLISNGRLVLAGAGAVLLWLAFVRAAISPAWPVAAWFAFGVLAVVHAQQLNRFERAQAAARVYLRGLDRLDDRWSGTGRDGATFGVDHPYAGDLDLFGPASLFERLNTTRTEAGEATLAEWLRGPAPIVEVRARQLAVDELRPMLDFREDVAVLASESPVGRTGLLAAWAMEPPVGFSPLVPWLLGGLALTTVGLVVAMYANLVLPDVLVVWIAIEVAIASFWRKSFHRVLHAVDMPDRDLGLVSELLARIESQQFASPRLLALHEALLTGGVAPSARIARLRALVSWLDSTHNLIFAPIAYVLLLRQQIAVRIARWHATYGAAIAEWLRAVGEVEAFTAIASYAYERPGDPFPELADEGPLFHAEQMAHPLLASAAAVRNDIGLGGDGPRVVVLSGSNMSGKSTFLRTIGVNVVLALAGAPVAARRLRLFLLDEILHGTNSYDRRIGAEGIVRALVALGAIGIVTTHDLALAELPSQLGVQAVNMHFEDRLEAGRMTFDYRLRPGVVEHSNALALMRTIGLDV